MSDGKRLEEMGDVIVVDHKKLANLSLVILVPAQVVRVFWPGLVWWDWWGANECLKRMVGRA